MKKQRALPFGYRIQNGEIVIVQPEARAVRSIFKMIENGVSLEAIATSMQKKGIPYSEANAAWDKHKVRRILENAKYTGTDGYPLILNEETYVRIRTLYAERTQAWQGATPNPERHIWQRLTCANCASKVTRTGCMEKDTTHLICKSCKAQYKYPTEDFKNTLLSLLKAAITGPAESTAYEPTQEIMRMENEINRGIDKPTDGSGTRMLILETALKRFEACPTPYEEPEDPGWAEYKDLVETALIGKEGVRLQLKQERKCDINAGIGQKCPDNPCQPHAHTNRQA